MLLTRTCDPEYSPWPYSKCNSPSARRPESPRMSDRYGLPLPVQPDWQGQQYSYLAQQHEGDIGSRSYIENRHGQEESRRQQLSADGPGQTGSDEALKREQESPEAGLGQGAGIKDFSKSAADDAAGYSERKSSFDRRDSYAAFGATGPYSRSSAPNHLRTVLSGNSGMDSSQGRPEGEMREGMTGLDDGDIEGEDEETETILRPQTTEERLAARRKMKRFRLTHHQTRFLMSEFAKQPHPDAAHRDRLSREIPGLSSRQVQVWFQNRRAKIKRMTADDRERMVRMRAVPEGFDNVQALHSPYGAVHGLGGPVSSPGEAVGPSYGNPMLRPLIVDVRRQEEAYISPSGLTPSFGGIELGQSAGGGGSTGGSDLVSPLSAVSVSSDQRYGTSLSSATSSTRPTTTATNLDSVAQMGRGPPGLRVGDSIPRSTPDSLQSPMRGNVSFDYANYQASSSDRHQAAAAYQGGHMAGSAMSGGFEATQQQSYSSHASSSASMTYHGMQQQQQQQPPHSPQSSRARSRTGSVLLPVNTDYRFRDAYRSSGPASTTPTQMSAPSLTTTTAAATSPTYARAQQGSHAPPPPLATKNDSNGHGYSTGHAPPGPLSAPLSLSSPRVFGRAGECPAPHMSAPMSAPGDFSRAFQGQTPGPPAKDYFGNTTSI